MGYSQHSPKQRIPLLPTSDPKWELKAKSWRAVHRGQINQDGCHEESCVFWWCFSFTKPEDRMDLESFILVALTLTFLQTYEAKDSRIIKSSRCGLPHVCLIRTVPTVLWGPRCTLFWTERFHLRSGYLLLLMWNRIHSKSWNWWLLTFIQNMRERLENGLR